MGSVVDEIDVEITPEPDINYHDGDGRRRRNPFHYPIHKHMSSQKNQDMDDSATYSRYMYYSHLDSSKERLKIPDHIVPPSFILPLAPYVTPSGRQNSIVTIFAMWNCMVGTSLLSMPWAIHQAGLIGGIASLVIMGTLCCYTAYRILNLQSLVGVEGNGVEFSDLCRQLLGKWAEWLSIFSSLLVLLGGAIVYWILMSNFLYHTVIQIYDVAGDNEKHANNVSENQFNVVCLLTPSDSSSNFTMTEAWTSHSNVTYDSTFKKYWNLYSTVPFFLILLTVPLVNMKSPTFFTKFNAFGTFSVMYLVTFICIKAYAWGVNASFSDVQEATFIPYFKSSFTILTGILALAYFIHNCIISIVRNQKNPENNTRDVIIAFTLVMSTYLMIGVLFYISFPLKKDCIDENLLNNFGTSDVLAFVARFFLLFQMLTVFPLLLYIFRAHFMYTVFGTVYPSIYHVILLNLVLIAICILFAIFLPHIGVIIRFVGAFCGFIYIFALPSVTYIAALNAKSVHAPIRAILHGFLVFIGLANVICQFFV